jgi:K+-sensing histidine kinase KdpD
MTRGVRTASLGALAWPLWSKSRLRWSVAIQQQRRWLVAVGVSVVAFLLARISVSAGGTLAPLYFLGAVAISGWYGGLAPALLATGIGFLSLDYYFETPRFSWDVSQVSTPVALAGFLVVAAALGSLNARLRLAHDRAQHAREAAERALVARDEALTIVSHDLRTPLTTITTAVATLRSPTAQLSEPTRQDLLRNIEVEAARLSHFVRDALALSRLESGIVANAQWNSAEEVISASLEHVFGGLSARPISVDVAPTLPLARFDAALLDQALTNILDNADVHTPPGSPILVSARTEGTSLRIEVSDAGPGVPREARPRIFEKFQRLERAGRGAGLGLAIARAATEAQGGRLTVDDSPLGGARFVVVLPDVVPGVAYP